MIKKAIAIMMLVLVISCPLASAGFFNFELTSSTTSIEVYPGQQIELEYEYTFKESELGANEIPQDVYRRAVKMVEGSPNVQGFTHDTPILYEDQFTVTMGETISDTITYTIDTDRQVGDVFYLDIYIFSYMDNADPWADGWFSSSYDRSLITVTVVPEPVDDGVIDDVIDIGDIGDGDNSAFDGTGLLIGVLAILSILVAWRMGLVQRLVAVGVNPPVLMVLIATTIIIVVVIL